MEPFSTYNGTEKGWNRSRIRTQRTEKNGMDHSLLRTPRTDLDEGPCSKTERFKNVGT